LKACQNVISQDKKSFEVHGFDVLIDANLKPWLIEVNASPSLSATTPHDLRNKSKLINDVLVFSSPPFHFLYALLEHCLSKQLPL
jgi:tubulin polyglutamylase TTLL1